MKIRSKLIVKIVFFVIVSVIYAWLHKYREFTHMSSDDLLWSQPYSINDTVVFIETHQGILDTMLIKDISIQNKSLPFSTGQISWREVYHANIRVSMIFKHNGVTYNRNSIFIIKYNDSIPCSISWNIMRLTADKYYILYNGNSVFDNIDEKGIKLETRVVNGVEYNDCIVGTLDNSHLQFEADKDSIYASEIIWSKQHGLIQYSMENEKYIFNKLMEARGNNEWHK